jgi:DNA-directed RNA polymerase subunit alpha
LKVSGDDQIPLFELNLSTRACGCLTGNGIHSIQQLIAKSETDLAAIPGLGATMLAEIKGALAANGLELEHTDEDLIEALRSLSLQ